MMNGSHGVFFMKQLDFLLLGIDHLVNTYNFIRNVSEKFPYGSFTIVPTVVDSGYDGPQSSFNNFNDLCSIARIKGFTVSNKSEADYLFTNQFLNPGFRIIALSQRLGKNEIISNKKPLNIFGNGEIFHYKKGKDVTIVSSNFSYSEADRLVCFLEKNNIKCSQFNISSGLIDNLNPIINDIAITKHLILIDDSKSIQTPVDHLLTQLHGINIKKIIILKRHLNNDWLNPVSDLFEIDVIKVLNDLTSK